MFQNFNHRSHRLERLDTGDFSPAEYTLWQAEMRWINRLLGDTRALRLSLGKELRDFGSWPVSILDVGAGSGELLKTAGKMTGNNAAFLVGAELNADAARSIGGISGMFAVQCDALQLPFADDSFDFVISSLFLHHLKDEQAITLIREMSRVARCRFIVIDLHRHAAAYYLYLTFGRLILQRFTLDDGSLSIRRGFRPAELTQLADLAGIRDAVVERKAAFRLVLSGRKF